MSLTGILDLLGDDRAVSEVLRIAREGNEPLVDLTAPPGLRAPLVAGVARATPAGAGRTVLAVTATGREAEDLANALRCFLPAHSVADFPAWETLPHERLSPRSDTVGRRLAVLRRLAHPDADGEGGPIQVVVAPVRAVLQPVVRGLGELVPVSLHAGAEVELSEVVERLAAAAYARTELVERRGEFAVRGGILDVFPPTEEHPLRVEFWGDTVEEIRWFAVADQRSLEIADGGLWAPPCRELLLTDEVRAKAAELAERLPGVADILGKVAAGLAVEGMESLTPALVDGMEPILDSFPAGTHIVVCDPERVRARAHDLGATSQEFLDASWMSAAAGSAVPVDLGPVLGTASFWSLAEVREHALKNELPWWSISPFGLDDEARDDGELEARLFGLEMQAPEAYRGDREQAIADIGGWLHDGWRVAIVTEGSGLARRVVEMLTEADLAVALVDDLAEAPAPSVAAVGTGGLGRGFVAPGLRLAVLTENDLTGGQIGGTTTKDMRRMPARRRNVVDPMQLSAGDMVVHEQHGVGW
jgi:transcription-repair coupling factor (superfamily II helicase)